MLWKNYQYEQTPEGITITKYLGDINTTELLGGKEYSLLYDLDQYGEGKPKKPEDRNPDEEALELAFTRKAELDDEERRENMEFSGFYGEEEVVRIPSQIRGIPVVGIGEDSFAEFGAIIRTLEIPSTVKRIEQGAFRMCMSLEQLILPEGLEEIGPEFLYLTPLSHLKIPYSLRSIGAPWELGNVTWEIPADHRWFFTDGTGLYYRHFDEQGEMTDQELLVVRQQESDMSYTVAEGTTIIGENAFAGQEHITEISLPPSVQIICDAAMESCQGLTHMELNEGLKEIQARAFSHCIRLKHIHLPASLRILGEYALSDTFGWSDTLNGLEQITVSKWNLHFYADDKMLYEKRGLDEHLIVKYFGDDRTFEIPDHVTEILPGAFRRAKLQRLTIPSTLRRCGKDAFKECKDLEDLILKESDTILYVPRTPRYRKDEVTALLCGEGEYLYDYKGYDRLFDTYLNMTDLSNMACCRLQYPVLLDETEKEKYRRFILNNMEEILTLIGESDSVFQLDLLSRLGFFTGENIDDCMDVINRSRKGQLMSFMIQYRQKNLGSAVFDFSL